MKKIILHGLMLASIFILLWLALGSINWMNIFGAEKKANNLNQKLGKMIYESIDKAETIIKDPRVTKKIDSLFYTLCEKNDIDTAGLKIHLVKKDMVNAFATPGGHIFVFSGLVNEASSQAELTGVIAHELAHIQLDHVMKKLVTEVGLSALVSMVSGSGGVVVVGEIVKLLSSSAYSRKLEKAADVKGADYLIKASVNPEGIADFIYKISTMEEDEMNLYWIQSHPDSKERAEYLAEYCRDKVKKPKDLLSTQQWEYLKNSLNSEN